MRSDRWNSPIQYVNDTPPCDVMNHQILCHLHHINIPKQNNGPSNPNGPPSCSCRRKIEMGFLSCGGVDWTDTRSSVPEPGPDLT